MLLLPLLLKQCQLLCAADCCGPLAFRLSSSARPCLLCMSARASCFDWPPLNICLIQQHPLRAAHTA
jgi:hypothetical protein